MNIFVLDYAPGTAARWHNDKHCSKMILETAQLMCTTLNLLKVETPYKSCHINHPCRIWAGKTLSNFIWLGQLGMFLGEEFEYRYNNKHKSVEVIKHCIGKYAKLPGGDLTPFALAMPDEYKVACPVQSYRNYYNGAKQNLAKWTKRDIPEWFVAENCR